MALKPQGNNILAGTSLAIAQIQSPDYVPGVSGWCIFQNGNAEFNSGTFRGFIVGGSLFIYNGTPGAGTLVASITSLTTDPFGNTTQPGGLTIYNGSEYLQVHVNATAGAPAIEMVTAAVSEEKHAAIYTTVDDAGLADEEILTTLLGPGSTFDGNQALIELVSATKNGADPAGGILGLFVSSVLQIIAFWDASGFFVTPSDGNTYSVGYLPAASAAPQLINSTTPATVETFNVLAGNTYRIEGFIEYNGAGAAGTAVFTFAGTASVTFDTIKSFFSANNTMSVFRSSPTIASPTLSTANQVWDVDMLITVTGTGTLLFQAKEGTAGDAFTINAVCLNMTIV